MKNLFSLHVIILVVLFSCSTKKEKPTGADAEIDQLLKSMTLEEKVGQMTNLTLSTVASENGNQLIIDTAKLRQLLIRNNIGSLQNVVTHGYDLEQWHELINTAQKMTMEESRLKIPFLYCIDAVHGTNYTLGSTLFPHNINLGATRNPELTEEASRITAIQARGSGIRYNFSPVLDVGRQPLWPRFPETFGEDVELVKVLGTASVRGYQGKDISSPERVAACLKHYIGYSVPANGKDRAPAYIPEIVLREYFLPPFEAAVKEGARTVMINSGEINGVPVHASKYLLTDILRKELGFDGVVISDWEDVKKLVERHKIAADHKEAVKLVVDAGIDMCIVPFDLSFYEDLIALVKEGKVTEDRINHSVRRILTLKKDLNLFKDPYIEKQEQGKIFDTSFSIVALQSAKESMVLLKNDANLLPLSKDAKLLITGPAASSVTALHGAWSYTWQGKDPSFFRNIKTIAQAFEGEAGEGKVKYVQGLSFGDSVFKASQELKAGVADAEYIIVCVGEDAYAETPGNISDLELPSEQKELVRYLASTGKRVFLALIEGRPRIIREIEPLCAGIIYAGWPGSKGGEALADVIYGDYNPDGKLPFTYPRYNNEILTYDHKFLDAAEEIVSPIYKYGYRFNPQYHFGHGLSYTEFSFSDLKLNGDKLKQGDSLLVSFKVKNTGVKAGKTVAELYSRDHVASVTPSVKRLRKFTKIHLNPGEEKELSFTLKEADLSFINQELKRVTEPGKFSVIIGEMEKEFEY